MLYLKRTATLALYIILTLNCSAQNLYNNLHLIDSTRVQEIYEMETYLSERDTSKKVSTTTFKIGGLTGLVFQKSKTTAATQTNTSILYYPGSNLVQKEYVSITDKLGDEQVSNAVNRYIYDNDGKLLVEISTTGIDSLNYIRTHKYNEYGDKVSSEYFDLPSFILESMPEYIKDTIIYDYSNNTKVWSQIAEDRSPLVSVDGSIRSYDDPSTIFDHLGNVLQNKYGLKVEYEYDDKGNWTFSKRYHKLKEGTHKLISTTSRELVYRNE